MLELTNVKTVRQFGTTERCRLFSRTPKGLCDTTGTPRLEVTNTTSTDRTAIMRDRTAGRSRSPEC